MVKRIRKQAKGEADVRYVGRIGKFETPSSLQKLRRPLVIGCSIGHHKITAGTLGCFVKLRDKDGTLILSNNHVLANENRAKPGDPIVQPGNLDGGKVPADVAATLHSFVRLKPRKTYFVACAITELSGGVTINQKNSASSGI